jgi:hypothetical protein
MGRAWAATPTERIATTIIEGISQSATWQAWQAASFIFMVCAVWDELNINRKSFRFDKDLILNLSVMRRASRPFFLGRTTVGTGKGSEGVRIV